MTKTYDDAELERLFARAQRECTAGSSTTDFEPAFVRLLEFIKLHPECHVVAEQRFLEGLTTKPLCWELISFCMHSLRMKAIRSEASRLIDPNNPRGWGPLSDIVASFEDEWEDAEMYEYYRARA